MKEKETFTIRVHDIFYIIKPYVKDDNTFYEVFTNCEKLFTLKKNQPGLWVTNEKDVIPISENIVEDIGEVLDEYEYQQGSSTL